MRNKRITGMLALMALACAGLAARGAEDQQRARELRAEATQYEVQGDIAQAIARYEESQQHVPSAIIAQKIQTLKARQGNSNPVADLAAQVYAKLDFHGYRLTYMNAESIVLPLREEIKALLAILAQAEIEEDRITFAIDLLASSLDDVLEWLGLYSLRAVGTSVVPIDGRIARAKTYMLREPEQSDRVLWRLYGQPAELYAHQYFTGDAVLVCAGMNGLGAVWSVVREGLDKFAPQLSGALDEQLTGMKMGTGIDVEAMLSSLVGNAFFALTLSETASVSMPVGDEFITTPEPGLLIGMRAADTTVQDTLLGFLRNSGMPVMERSQDGSTLYSINLPLPVPFTVQPAMTMHDDMLLIGTTPSLIERAIRSFEAGGELLEQEAFKQAIGPMPENISSLSYVATRFHEEYARIYTRVLEVIDGDEVFGLFNERLLEMIEKEADNFQAAYTTADHEGILYVAHLKTPYENPLVATITGALYGMTMAGLQAAEQARMQREMMEQFGTDAAPYTFDEEEVTFDYQRRQQP